MLGGSESGQRGSFLENMLLNKEGSPSHAHVYVVMNRNFGIWPNLLFKMQVFKFPLHIQRCGVACLFSFLGQTLLLASVPVWLDTSR